MGTKNRNTNSTWGIAIRRDVDADIQNKVQRLIRKSLEFAFEQPSESLSFVREHAQEMDSKVMKQHIDLYVNDYSLALGNKGREAIECMYRFMQSQGSISSTNKTLFV